MARAPYSPLPDVQPSGPAPARYDIRASPASFGGLIGGAEERLGEAGQQDAQRVSQAGLVLQNEQNRISAANAFGQYQTFLTHQSAHYLSLHGKDAMDSWPALQESVEAERQKILGGMNEASGLAFDQSSRRVQMFTMDSMRNHFIQEQNNWGQATYKSNQDSAVTAIGVQPFNDTLFNNNLAQMRINTQRFLQIRGEADDATLVEDALTKGETQMIVGRVEAMMARDPVNGAARAQEWLQHGQIPDIPAADGKSELRAVSSFLPPLALNQLMRATRAGAEEAQVAAGAQSVINSAPPAEQGVGGAVNSAWHRLVTYEHGENAQGQSLVSPTGAMGATQMEPATAQETAQKHGVPYNPSMLQPGPNYDSSYAHMLGRLHFSDLMQHYGGNVTLATAAYNAGEGAVDGWLKTIGDPRNGVISDADWAAHIPYKETRDYVMNVAQPSTAPETGPVAGAPQHNPAAYDIEAAMLERGYKKAHQLFPDNPALQQKMMEPIREHINEINMLQAKREAEQAKAQKDAQNAVMNHVITVLNSDPTKFDPAMLNQKDAQGAYVLTPEQRVSLMDYSKRALADHGIDDTAPYGPGYAKAYADIFAPPDSGERINDLADILRRAGPGGDLTTRGAQRLAQVFSESRRSPDRNAIARTESGLLQYAKSRLSFQQDSGVPGIPGLKDVAGERAFNAEFIPRFEAGLSAAEASGDPQKVWQYLTKENVDKIMTPWLRTPAQIAQAKLAASGQEAPGITEAPNAPLPAPPGDIVPQGGRRPVQVNPGAWHAAMTGPRPEALNHAQYAPTQWAKILSYLLAHPDTVAQFDERFGGQGFDGAQILKQLTAPVAQNTALPSVPAPD